MVKTVFMGQKNAGGGSTITQQLAKQLYSPSSDGPVATRPAETHRVDDSREARALLFEGRDHKDVSPTSLTSSHNAVGIKSAAYV